MEWISNDVVGKEILTSKNNKYSVYQYDNLLWFSSLYYPPKYCSKEEAIKLCLDFERNSAN